MGLLNCKCESEEDKAVLVEDLGKNKLKDPLPIKPLKQKFSTLILSYQGDLTISCKETLLSLPIFIYSQRIEEITEWKTIELHDGKYIGETAFCMPHGRGFKILVNGGVIEGNWKDGVLNGKSRLIYSNGDYFEGEFLNGTIQGGVLVSKNGSRYEGEWENYKQNGKGKEIWEDGAEYNGRIYLGEFTNDLRNGFGKLIWPNGKSYAGRWINGKDISLKK